MNRMAQDIWQSSRAQPGRVAVCFFALLLGAASLTVVATLMRGLQNRARRLQVQLGANVLMIVDREEPPSRGPLNKRHRTLLSANLPDCLVSGYRRDKVATRKSNQELTVLAVDLSFAAIRRPRIVEGRFIDAHDMENRSRHVVVTRGLSTAWNWHVGDRITLGKDPYTIVGVVDQGSSENRLASSPDLVIGDHVAFIPETSPAGWTGEVTRPDGRLHGMLVAAPDVKALDKTARRSHRLLEQAMFHTEGIEWITAEGLLAPLRRLERTVSLVGGGIAGLCLVLGGCTMMALMLANVRERVLEIGLRRALGATATNIVALFVVEAAVVSICAAVCGAALAWLGLGLMEQHLAVPAAFEPGVVSAVILTVLVLSVLFSSLPARAAARIQPAEALRYD